MRAPKEAAVHGFRVHIDNFPYGFPESVVLTVSGSKLEVVYVDD